VGNALKYFTFVSCHNSSDLITGYFGGFSRVTLANGPRLFYPTFIPVHHFVVRLRLSWYRDQWRALVNTVMNPYKRWGIS
jgi:hypothetical protein